MNLNAPFKQIALKSKNFSLYDGVKMCDVQKYKNF